MPHKGKQKLHIQKLAESKKKAQNESAKESAEITNNNQGQKYQKRPFQEIQPEILDEKTRSGTSQPGDRNDPSHKNITLRKRKRT